jgi:hypothetical protein
MDLHWFANCEWPFLSFTLVKGGLLEVLLNPTFQCRHIACMGNWSGGSAKLLLKHEHGKPDSGSNYPGGW